MSVLHEDCIAGTRGKHRRFSVAEFRLTLETERVRRRQTTSTTMTSASSSTAATTPGMTDEELEKLLHREASAFNREMEVERILKAFKLKYVLFVQYCLFPRTELLAVLCSPFEILDINEDSTPEAVKKRYKQLSLCEHPSPRCAVSLRAGSL
jgi:preprotein translocase subunit Sec63